MTLAEASPQRPPRTAPDESPTAAPTASKPVRDGNAAKRAAILAAARELFVRDGVERTSMDAVSRAAGVSKRTVYDYYGDKRRLLLGVIEAAGESLLGTLRAAVADHLADDLGIHDVAGLERALADFAIELGESMMLSSDYAATFRLVAENGAALPELAEHPLADTPEETIAERLAHFADAGLLELTDARVAADHFNALTTLLAFNGRLPGQVDTDRVRQSMVDGVHAFIRAYGRRD